MLFALSASVGSATILHNWDFNEVAGTGLTGTANTGLYSDTWHANMDSVQTSGTGSLMNTAGVSDNSRVNVGNIQEATFVYFVTEFNSWDLSNSPSVSIRLSLMDNLLPDLNSQITAESRMRISDGAFQMQAQALSAAAGGESSSWGDIVSPVLTEPLKIMTAYSKELHEYGVYYQYGNDPWQEFFYGAAATTRDANSMRLVFGNITGDDYIDINRIYLSTTNPIPEPQTYAMIAGVAIFGFVLYRRRFNKAK